MKVAPFVELVSAIRRLEIVLTVSGLCPNSTPSETGVRAESFSPAAFFLFFRCAPLRVHPPETN
jgi:hypothetical protein